MLGLPVLLACGYLAVLAALSVRHRPGGRLRTTSPVEKLRFRLVVPAHDEGSGVARTVRSLLALDYPPELRRVWVVADNCSDHTAEAAAAAGAEVLVRTEPTLLGKGYALALAFERCLTEGWAQAVVVVDADTVVEPNLLTALAEAFADGAEALQVHYGILADRSSAGVCACCGCRSRSFTAFVLPPGRRSAFRVACAATGWRSGSTCFGASRTGQSRSSRIWSTGWIWGPPVFGWGTSPALRSSARCPRRSPPQDRSDSAGRAAERSCAGAFLGSWRWRGAAAIGSWPIWRSTWPLPPLTTLAYGRHPWHGRGAARG